MDVVESGLNDKQEKAIRLVMAGRTDAEVAKAVGVSRQWVNRWRNQDEDFRYALQIRRELLRERHLDQLSELTEAAFEAVKEALKCGDLKTKLKAAIYVLKLAGLQEHNKPGVMKTRVQIEKEQVVTGLEAALREMGF